MKKLKAINEFLQRDIETLWEFINAFDKKHNYKRNMTLWMIPSTSSNVRVKSRSSYFLAALSKGAIPFGRLETSED